jgi:hypothetical protein
LEARLRLRLAHPEASGGPPAALADVTEAVAAPAARPPREPAAEGAAERLAPGPAELTPEEAEMLSAEPIGAGMDREVDDVLPSLDELTGRVPPAVVAAMDELFRAKWTEVRRLPRGGLKTEADA